MAFNYGGTDEESAEIKKLNAEVVSQVALENVYYVVPALIFCVAQLEDTDNFENWEKLVRAAETLEGGLNRNSSPQAIATTRDAYDRFLAKFPLLFGYWKKYADLEFSIAGTEAAEMVGSQCRIAKKEITNITRSSKEASLASQPRSTCGRIIVHLKLRQAMIPM